MNETATKPLAKQSPKPSIRDWLQSQDFQKQAMLALPKGANYVRFARSALTATFTNPKLLDCTQSSFLNSLMRLAQANLEPDGRRAHLIPRKNKDGTVHCTLMIDYKGIAEQARRNGDVASIHCDVVCDNDQFSYWFGTGARLEHVPDPGERVPEPPKPGKPGNVRCAYAFVRLKDGSEEFDVMSTEEIERVRRRSPAADDGPWVTDWPEMAKKTVFRRLSKLLTLSPELVELLEHDEEPLTERERFNAAKPVAASVAEAPTAPKRGRPTKEPETPRADIEQSSESLFGEQQMPPGSVAESEQPVDVAKEQNAPETVLARVQILLIQHGFVDAHLLELLRRVKLIKDQKNLGEVDDEALRLVLEDWENCEKRLEQIKAGK
jgi:recombination protein RecT